VAGDWVVDDRVPGEATGPETPETPETWNQSPRAVSGAAFIRYLFAWWAQAHLDAFADCPGLSGSPMSADTSHDREVPMEY
jgi:hypothetical protein